MAPRPDVSEERRSQIIDSAIKVFTRKGFADARMDDVAAESGLSKGLLYWYFKSKEEIIIAISDLLFGAEFRTMEVLSSEGGSARECLEKFLDLFIQDLRGIQKVAPVIYEFYALAFRNAMVRRVMQRYLRRFLAFMEPVIRRGMDSGEFVRGDPREKAIAVGAALEGTMLLWAYAPKLFDPERQLRGTMALTLEGLVRK
ncbi:MAG: TetR/AcrR family transcriptional regulator [Anaerolineales bacterium]|nr:TetR/AcrR family transcriptional regulator [Anaerolineales bacterium]